MEESNHGNIKGKNSPKVKRGKEVGEDDVRCQESRNFQKKTNCQKR